MGVLNKSEKITYRLDRSAKGKIEAYCEFASCSPSEFTRACVNHFLALADANPKNLDYLKSRVEKGIYERNILSPINSTEIEMENQSTLGILINYQMPDSKYQVNLQDLQDPLQQISFNFDPYYQSENFKQEYQTHFGKVESVNSANYIGQLFKAIASHCDQSKHRYIFPTEESQKKFDQIIMRMKEGTS